MVLDVQAGLFGAVVQLVRMLPCHGRGRGFESRPLRKKRLFLKQSLFHFMPFFFYIIQSQRDSSFYKGFSEDVFRRLLQHNAGESNYTSTKMPWKLVYFEALPDKKTALIREKNLKKADKNRIEALIKSNKNLLNC